MNLMCNPRTRERIRIIIAHWQFHLSKPGGTCPITVILRYNGSDFWNFSVFFVFRWFFFFFVLRRVTSRVCMFYEVKLFLTFVIFNTPVQACSSDGFAISRDRPTCFQDQFSTKRADENYLIFTGSERVRRC